jgi:hypothetical protein
MVELLSAKMVNVNRPYRRLEGIFLGQFPPTALSENMRPAAAGVSKLILQ